MEANNNITTTELLTSLSRWIQFGILLPFTVASILCCIVLLFYFYKVRKLRTALHNHVIMVLVFLDLIYLTIDPPFYLQYLRFNHVYPTSSSFCLVWWVASGGIHETVTILMAWAAIERHILVLHKQWISTNIRRFLLHYCPIGLIILYGIIFYSFVIFFPTCDNQFDFDEAWCSEPCIYSNSIFSNFQLVFNEITMTVFIAFFSVTLIIRIVWQRKRRLHQAISWKKHRKMTIQLLSIAANYLFFHLLDMFITLVKPFDLESEFGLKFQMYMDFISFFAELLLPWLCLVSLYPKPWAKSQREVGAETMIQNQSLRRFPTQSVQP